MKSGSTKSVAGIAQIPVTSFATRLRRARNQAGLTQEELAERAGLTSNAIGALERGERRHPYPATVRALADALGMNGDERVNLIVSLPKRGQNVQLNRGQRPDLPLALSSLIGREDDVTHVTALLRGSSVRLLTLTGPGGVGKTSLALRIANELMSDFVDGIALAQLASIRDDALVASAIAQAIGVDESGGGSTIDRIVDFLRDRQLLLVIDNFEHVLVAAPIVTELLTHSDKLVVLATSRAELRLTGERSFPVAPLTVPGVEISDSVQIAKASAIQLFAERASAVDPSFALTLENTAEVAEICRRLDGIPLAIELAAARSRMFTPAMLISQMSRSLPLLKNGRRDAAPRHQTMHNAIEWSYDLLSQSEKQIFYRLAHFAGGFNLKAARAVVASGVDLESRPGNPELGVIDGIAALVEQRLLHRIETTNGEPRFAMLETIREFAAEQLILSGEDSAIREAHAAWYVSILDEASNHWFAVEQSTWASRIETEHDNIRAVLSIALESGNGALATHVAGRMWPFWIVRGHIREGRQWIQRSLDLDHDAMTLDRARTLTGAARIARYLGDVSSAREFGEQALHLCEANGAATGIEVSHILIGLSLTAANQQDFVQAAKLNEWALALLQPLKATDPRAADFECLALIYLANIFVALGNDDRANELANISLDHARRVQWEWGEIEGICCLAPLEYRFGNFARSAELCRRGLLLSMQQRDPWPLIMLLDFSGIVAGATGQAETGARLIGAADQLATSIGLPSGSIQYVGRDQGIGNGKRAMGAELFDLGIKMGKTISFEEALAHAMAMTDRKIDGEDLGATGVNHEPR